jgi:chemotaxis protein MotA
VGRPAGEVPQQLTADLRIRIIKRLRDAAKFPGNAVQQVYPFHFVRVRVGRDQRGDGIHFPADLPQVAGLQGEKDSLGLSSGIRKLYLHVVLNVSSDARPFFPPNPQESSPSTIWEAGQLNMTRAPRRFAFTSVAGFAIAAACVLGGLLLEKGEVSDVGQVTAALIVFGGTVGAVLVSTPNGALLSALRRLRSLLWEEQEEPSAVIEELIRYSRKARATGIVSLESEAEEIEEPFFRKGMMLLVDGVEAAEIRRVMELDLIIFENQAESDAKVFDTAGGYAPTIGIIGAVIGLIQVMKHLESLGDVGHGIAVAFVATLYGVGLANLVLLPIASRIRVRSQLTAHFRELIVEGVIILQAGMNPRLVERMLEGFTNQHTTAVTNPAVKSGGGNRTGAPHPANTAEAG